MNIPENIFSNIGVLIQKGFSYPDTKKQKSANRIWLIGLFLLGFAAWGYFFSWGNFTVEFHDWSAITAPRLQFLKNAVSTIQLPLHISDPSTLNYVTDRYLSIPDSFISPQFIFLRWMDIQTFSFVNFLLFYVIGFWGLLKFREKFKLSPVVFTILFLLFNFNGHIVAHLSVGHDTWSGYFLFPWFALLVFKLLEGDHSWKWVAKLSVTLLVMFLQGSFHQFVWAILFLILLGIFIPKTFWWSIRGAFFACLAAMARILPPALLYDKFDNKFLAGYPTIGRLWQSMVEIAIPADLSLNKGLTSAIGVWELSLYVGLAGAIFLIGFGLVRWMHRGESGVNRQLLLPLAALTLLSMGKLYFYFEQLHIPLFTGERVSTRIISLVFTFILIIAAAECQKWLNQRQPIPALYGGVSFGLLLLAHDLWQNLTLWKINSSAEYFIKAPFDPPHWTVNNNINDRGYFFMILAGLLISLVSLGVLAFLTWRENKKQIARVDS